MSKLKWTQKDVFSMLNEKGMKLFTVPLVFIDILGDHKAAMMLSQLLYWTRITKDPDGWIYKSYAEWYKELRLKESVIRRAKEILEDKKIVQTKNDQGGPIYFRIVPAVFKEVLLQFTQVPPRENQSGGTMENEVSSIAESTAQTTDIDYLHRVPAEKPPAGSATLIGDLPEEIVSDSKREYADELTSQIDKVLPDKYRIGRLPKKYVSKLLVLNTVIEPDTIEEYIRWYLDIKEPTKGCSLGLLLFKDMGVEYVTVRAEYKKVKKGKRTTTRWNKDEPDEAMERFKKFMESQKK